MACLDLKTPAPQFVDAIATEVDGFTHYHFYRQRFVYSAEQKQDIQLRKQQRRLLKKTNFKSLIDGFADFDRIIQEYGFITDFSPPTPVVLMVPRRTLARIEKPQLVVDVFHYITPDKFFSLPPHIQLLLCCGDIESNPGPVVFQETAIALFVFDSTVPDFHHLVRTLKSDCCYGSCSSNCHDYSSLLFRVYDINLYKVLSKVNWDEMCDNTTSTGKSTVLLPYRFHNIFDDCDITSEWACVQRLLLLAGDIETNPGPVMSKLYTQSNEPRVYKAHLGIGDLCKEFSAFNKNLDELKILQRSFDHVNDTVSNIIPMLSTNVTASTQLAADSFTAIKDDMIKYGVLLCLVQGIFAVGARKTGLCAALLVAGHLFKVDKWLMDLFNELIAFVQNHHMRAHMHVEELLYDPTSNIIAKVVFGIVALFAVKKIPGKQDWDNYMLRLDRIPKAVDGSKKIWKMVSSYLDVALDHVKMMVLGQDSKEFSAHYSIAEDIENWTKEVNTYIQLEQRKKLTYDAEIANKVAALYPRGQTFLANPTLPNELQKLVKNFIHPAYMLYKHVHESPTGSAGPKQRPTVLWLVGDSQIGKSTLVWNLCADMLHVMGYTELSYMIYARQCETNYWDGYFFQPVVVYDDAFAKKDDKTVPNPEIFETIRSCNNFPQHLHMAAVPDKNTYAKMQMMLYTSNAANVQLESITNPEAFWNRMNDNCYRVTLKSEYAIEIVIAGKKTTQRLDLSKVPRKPNGKAQISDSMYLFQKQIWDLNENKFFDVGNPIEYEELRQIIYQDWKQKGELFLDHTQDLKERMERGWKAHMRFSDLLLKEKQVQVEAEVHVDSDNFVDAVDTVQDVQDQITDLILKNSHLDSHEMKIAIMDHFCQSQEQWNAFQFYQLNKNKTYLSDLKIKLQSGFQTCQNYISKCIAALKDVASRHPYLMALGAIAAVAGIGTLIYSLMSEEEEDEDIFAAELAHSGSQKSKQSSKVKAELAHSGARQNKTQQKFKAENWTSDDQKEFAENQYGGSLIGSAVLGVMKKYKLGLYKESAEFAAHLEIASNYDLTNTMVAHAVCDANAHEIVTSKIRDNTFRLSVKHERPMEGNVTFICGKIFVMPYHYLTMMHTMNVPLDTEITLNQECFKKRMMSFKLSHLLENSSQLRLTENVVHAIDAEGKKIDLVFVNLHRELSYPLKDIRGLFISRDSQSKLVKGEHHGAMVTYGYYKTSNPDEMILPNKGICRDYKSFNSIKLHLRERKLDVSVPGGKFQTMNICNYYEMSGVSTPGDCGSILCIYDRRLNDGKAIAMHNGGESCQSMAIPMCREMIETNIARWKSTCAHFSFQEPSTFVDSPPILPKGKFVAIGKSSLKVSHPVKTILRKSKLYGYLREPIKRPAHLVPFEHEGEIYDPVMKGLEKCGGDCELLDNNILRECAAAVSQEINQQYVSLENDEFYHRFLTYEEAVKGVDDDYAGSINRISSPGFPYMCDKRKLPGKMSYLGANEEFDCVPGNFKTKDAQIAYDETMKLIENCKNGVLTDVIWVDTKKDELRPINKISTRMFAAGPMHFVIALRMYFLPFCAWLMHNRLDNGIAVGVNPFVEWDKMAKLLTSKSDKIIAGDFSNYDGSLNSQVLWSIFHDIYIPWVEMMHGFISLEDYSILFGLWCHIVHSVHLNGDNFYMWTHSQPSGNPLTALLNSLYNKMILRLAWNKIFDGSFDFAPFIDEISVALKEPFVLPSLSFVAQEKFSENVCEETYGDDHCVNVSDRAIMWFNQLTLTKAFESLGHIYTDETKSGKSYVFRHINEIQFLKRGFRFDESLQKVVGPLDEAVIYEMMNWIRLSKTNLDETFAMKENCEVAMREMVYHGEEKYNQLIQDLKKNIFRFSKSDLPIFFPFNKQLRDVRSGYDIENLSWF